MVTLMEIHISFVLFVLFLVSIDLCVFIGVCEAILGKFKTNLRFG